MADNITPEEVPSTGTLENILGFDAADRWAKMPGATLAKAADLAVTEGKVATAQEAAETASSAAASAQSAADEARTAATQAVANANRAIYDTTKLYGFHYNAYMPTVNVADVSALWFVTGLADPTATLPPANQTEQCRTVAFINVSGAKTLNIYALNKVAEGLCGEIVVFDNAGTGIRVTDAGKTVLGAMMYAGGDGDSGPMMFRFQMIRGSALKLMVDDLVNCRWQDSAGVVDYPRPSGGASVTVDAALSTASENPVQNKVITAALDNKLSKYGQLLSVGGTPLWVSDGQTLYLPSSNRIPINAALLANVATMDCVSGSFFMPGGFSSVLLAFIINGTQVGGVTFSGLDESGAYMASVRAFNSGGAFRFISCIQKAAIS